MADKELEQNEQLDADDKTLYVEISPGVYVKAVLAVAAVGTVQVSAGTPVPTAEA